MAFKYKKPSSKSIKERAEKSSSDFIGYIMEEHKTYKPAPGPDNWIRFFPGTWEDPKHYGYEVHVHHQVGPDNATLLCIAKTPNPKTGKTAPCPLCKEAKRFESKGDEEMSKAMRPRKSVLAWVKNKRDKDKGPLIWAMPQTCDTGISKISVDRETGDTFYIDAPDDGYDVTFSREGEKINTKYSGFALGRRANSLDSDELQHVVDNPIPECLIFRDADEMTAIYEGEAAAPAKKSKRRDDDDEDDDDEAPRKKAKRAIRDDDDEDEAPKKKAKRRPEPDDDEDEDEQPKRKAKKPPVDEDDDEDEEEEDERPARKKAAPAKAKRRAADEDDDDEEEDEDDEDEAPPKRKGKVAPTKAPLKKRARIEEEDDDEDEDEEEAPPKKKGRVALKTKAKDEEEEEEDDRIPSKASRKAKKPADDEDEDEDDDDDRASAKAAALKKKFGGKK